MGDKNWLKNNMKTVLIFVKKKRNKDIVKLNFLQCLDAIAMRALCPKI